jgi:hypothetical protein
VEVLAKLLGRVVDLRTRGRPEHHRGEEALQLLGDRLELLLNALLARLLPPKGVNRKCSHVTGVDPASAKGFDERHPVVQVVVRYEVEIRRDDGAKVVTEGDVHRRTVVEGANAHVEHVLRRLRRLGGKPIDEIGVKRSGGRDARAARSDAE